MKTQSEMTNAELAEKIDNIALANLSQVPLSEIMDVASEAAKRLRAMPEEKPEFFVGWKGKDIDGDACSVYAIGSGMMFGECHGQMTNWHEDGDETDDDYSSDLIPNTPPAPETMWRSEGGTMFTDDAYKKMPKFDKDRMQKVEVRVIP